MQKYEKPLIGITANYEGQKSTLAETYYQSVLRAGGLPMILPAFLNDRAAELEQLLEPLDGIIFSGGGDINPLLLDEEPIPQLHSVCPERDAQEMMLAKLAAERRIPILGICRGLQVITAALGGTLYQDIYAQQEGVSVKHSQDMPRNCASHTVRIAPESVLHGIYKKEFMQVNSFHHQAVKQTAPGMTATACSADGVVEAAESHEFQSILGVQWHPECLVPNDGEKDVFDWLVDEATSFKQAKQVHSHIVSLDSHCDTPTFFHLSRTAELDQDEGTLHFAQAQEGRQVDLKKMVTGHLDATIMVAYLQQQERDEASLRQATERANRIFTKVEEMVGQVNQLSTDGRRLLDIARTPADLYRLKQEGTKAIMLGIENGYAIGRDIGNVEKFRQRGVVYMTLCHNGDNDLCDAAVRSEHEHGGVSDFGAKVIEEMNRVGMMVDLSHGGEKSFYDALDISRKPIVCSHSSSRALCDHPRNLTDEQMRALARSGGVAQVTIYSGFLRTPESVAAAGREASILDVVAHLNHMVDVMGIEHVGIGTDFDGGGGVPGCNHAGDLINFTRQLLRHRYSEHDLRLVWGENFLRVMRENQQSRV